MKEILEKRLRGVHDPTRKYNLLREGLQHLILKVLDDENQFKSLCFVGGTALRVLFDLRRFSEDLDFSLQKPSDPHFDFSRMLALLKKRLDVYDFQIDIKTKQVGAVYNVFFRFKNILQEWGVIQRPGQKISVKLEVDTHPPEFGRFETRIVQKDFMFSVVHYDLPTLFAGKLLAFLFRGYTKGRDLYDLIWFLTQKTPVNRKFFESGLTQALKEPNKWSAVELKEKIAAKLEASKMPEVIRDIQPFLEDPAEIRFFDKILLGSLLKSLEYETDH